MIVRPAEQKDVQNCAKISHIPEFSSLRNVSDEAAQKYMQEFLDKGVFLVAEDDDEIVGFIFGEFALNDSVWVDALTVKEEFRGQGVGKQLLQRFRELLKSKGMRQIYLMAPKFNAKTLQFYRSMGLEEGREFVEFSEDL